MQVKIDLGEKQYDFISRLANVYDIKPEAFVSHILFEVLNNNPMLHECVSSLNYRIKQKILGYQMLLCDLIDYSEFDAFVNFTKDSKNYYNPIEDPEQYYNDVFSGETEHYFRALEGVFNDKL